ncbi:MULTISPECIES: barstar family protein [Actinosynnema]|uniref:Barnase inhibitor n=1 Tax=Actinosynnema pretiosum TaxID=42197 RepID=A0A290Z1K6_9PSEU|nr:barnase inhibitor [Actinosynnema pretiosum]
MTARAVREAQERGAHPHVLAGAEITGKRAALDAIAAALSFPDWFGRNLDALYDCLVDLSWLPEGEHVLIWPQREVFDRKDPVGSAAVDSVLRDAAEQGAEGRVLTVVYPAPL